MNDPRRRTKPELARALCLTAAILLCPSAAEPRTLEFVQQHVDVDLFGAESLAVSADGKHVYVGGYNTLVFERDDATGELDFADATTGAEAVTLSPDGRNLYLHQYGKLRVLARDPESGSSTLVEDWATGIAGIHNFSPRVSAISGDGRHVYMTSVYSPTLAVFAREARTGALRHVEMQYDGVDGVVGLDGATHLTVSPDGRQVYVVASPFGGPSSLAVFSRDAGTGALSFVEALVGGADGIEALAVPRSIRVAPDGRHAYVACLGGVVAFSRNPSSGVLSFAGIHGGRATSLAISPEGTHLYAAEDSGATTVSVFARDPDDGALSSIETFSDGLGLLRDAEALSVTRDGRHLYIVGSNNQGWVAGLARNPNRGTLSFVAAISEEVAGDVDGVSGARSLAASPDGRHLYVASGYRGMSALSRSAETGGVQFIASYDETDGFEGMGTAEHMAISPDGRNVYVTSRRPNHALLALARDTSTGELDYLEEHYDGVGGVIGLDDLGSVTVSPDGRNVYVASRGHNAVAAFTRDVNTGSLVFLATYFEGIHGHQGLYRARTVTVSRDGEHVYVFSYRAVAVFDRDPETGELDFIEAHFEGVAGVERLGTTTYDVAISPDDRHLYIDGAGAVVAFRRDVSTGELSFLQAQSEGANNARSLAVSPDGEHVYLFGRGVSVFSRNPSTGALHLIETENLLRYSSYWGSTGIQSPDGNHLYTAATIGTRLDALVVLRTNDGLCQSGTQTLCLADNRFRVEVDWRDHPDQTGSARAVPQGTGESGLLWFFDAENWEMQVKVLDACGHNDRFWLLAAATTDVEYTLRVTDVAAGVTRSYFNPLGNPSSAIIDTFATCDTSAPGSGASSQGAAAMAERYALEPSAAPVETSPIAGQDVAPETDRWTMDHDLAVSSSRSAPKGFEPRTLLVGTGEKCLDIEDGVAADGTPVNLYDCHRGSNQRWYFIEDCDYGGCSEDFEIRGLDDKCLQPAAAESSATPLVVGECGGAEDRWVYRGYYPDLLTLEHVASGQCADVEGGGSGNGTPVNLYDCHGGDNQIWDFRAIRCVESPIHRCLNQGRFEVEVEWRSFTGETGLGRPVRHDSYDSGLFWFFESGNWEMLIKVLDGCANNGHHWVFAAGTTNVEYTLRVTDTETGQVREYFNPLGQAAPAITDTAAFATCP